MRVPHFLLGALLTILSACAAPALAQTPPPIAPPATGDEKVTCIQGGVPKTCTTGQITNTNVAPTSILVNGEGVPELANKITSVTQTSYRQSALVAQITGAATTLSGTGAAAVGAHFSGATGAGANPVWGMASIAQWSAGSPDVSIQAGEFDVNNNVSGTYAIPKLGVSIVSGGVYTGGFGLYVSSTTASNAFGESILVNGWNGGGDGLLIRRFSDTSPAGYFARYTTAAGGVLAYVDTAGNNLAQSYNINGAANSGRPLLWSTNGVARWQAIADGTAESGGNAGSNFNINRYSDAGALLGTGLQINRATGQVFIPGSLLVAGGIYGDGCANILAYGGDKTGATDNSAAVALVISTFGSKNICLYFPAGTYLFNSAISLQAGSSSDAAASLTVMGDGADLTRIKMASAINGVNVSLNDCTQSFHLRDFSVLAGNKSTTTVGINVAQSGTCTLPNPAQNDISGVTVRGTDGYNAAFRFGTGIGIVSASNVNFQNVAVIGSTDGAAYGSAGTCLSIVGSSSLLPVQFNLVASQFNDCGTGLLYGAYVQGVQITASNFVGNGTAISLPSANVGNDQLAISASQFNSGTRNIFLQSNIDGVALSGNTFYTSGTASASVDIPGVQYAITGNAFIQLTGTPSTGISIGAYSLDTGTITGNTFSGFNTAVFLQTGSQHANVQSNAYANTSTNVNNSGTSNTVGGGSQ